jgi:hypothetical protein
MFSLLMIGLDWQLVILAGCVCLLAAIAAASLFARVRRTSGRAQAMWVIAGAVVVLSASTAIEVVVRQANGIGLIAAGAVIGLGLGAGLYWLATGPAGASSAQIVLDASETVAKDIARLRANVESFLAQR